MKFLPGNHIKTKAGVGKFTLSGISHSLAFPLVIFCVLFLSVSCKGGGNLYKKSAISMDTLVTITVVSSSEKGADKAIDSAFAEINRIGKLLNFFSADSEVTQINRSAGIAPVKVSPDTLEIIGEAIDTAEKTDGAFDITIGAVSPLWDFHKKELPSKDAVKEKIKLVGYKNIVLDKEHATVFLKKKGMAIDLGGITKGYAADKAAKVLQQQGIHSGIVAAAGDIRAFGARPDGTPWKIGIENPRKKDEGDEVFAVVSLSNQAISTSGDYERFFFKDGVRYHHILDPKTGYPAYGCRSVTVITGKGVHTDAFSTAVFILGPRKGMEALKRLGFDGVIVSDDGTISVTDGIRGKVEFARKKT